MEVMRNKNEALLALNKAGFTCLEGKNQIFISRSGKESIWLKIKENEVSEKQLKIILQSVGCGYL